MPIDNKRPRKPTAIGVCRGSLRLLLSCLITQLLESQPQLQEPRQPSSSYDE